MTPPTLSLIVFRLLPPELPNEGDPNDEHLVLKELNELNLKLHENTTSKLFLTRTDLGGSICLRMSTGGYRTEERHVMEAFEILEQEAQQLVKGWSTKKMTG